MSNQVTSVNMSYCSHNWQLAAESDNRVSIQGAAYALYAFGGSFFVGLTRLIAAIGALCVDYTGKAKVLKEHNFSHQAPSPQDINSWMTSETRVENPHYGYFMCEADISSHWKQVARAIAELTIVGGWIYAGIDAFQQYSQDANTTDPLNVGLLKGMVTRMTSELNDRQYVPDTMISS